MLLKINKAIKSLPSSNATIKGKASQEPKDGWFPAYSASGQDVWLPEYRFATKGIVVSAVGARCGKAFRADGKWNICANTHPLYIDEDIALRDFCWYMLNNEKWWIKGGTAQPFVKVNESLNREFDFPLLTEQKHIVDVLDTLSNILMQKKTEINKLDNLVKARFVEMFGNVTTNDKNWPTKPISSVAPARSPKIITTEGVWLLNLDMIEPQSGKVLNKLIVPKDKINVSTCSFDDKNVLYSKLRPYLNKVVLPDQEGYCTAELVPLRPNNELNREFLAALLRSRAFVDYINGKTAGAKMPRVSMGIFRQFECILPPIRLQERFSTFYKQVDKSKFAIQKSLEKTQLLFGSLMQEYFG